MSICHNSHNGDGDGNDDQISGRQLGALSSFSGTLTPSGTGAGVKLSQGLRQSSTTEFIGGALHSGILTLSVGDATTSLALQPTTLNFHLSSLQGTQRLDQGIDSRKYLLPQKRVERYLRLAAPVGPNLEDAHPDGGAADPDAPQRLARALRREKVVGEARAC